MICPDPDLVSYIARYVPLYEDTNWGRSNWLCPVFDRLNHVSVVCLERERLGEIWNYVSHGAFCTLRLADHFQCLAYEHTGCLLMRSTHQMPMGRRAHLEKAIEEYQEDMGHRFCFGGFVLMAGIPKFRWVYPLKAQDLYVSTGPEANQWAIIESVLFVKVSYPTMQLPDIISDAIFAGRSATNIVPSGGEARLGTWASLTCKVPARSRSRSTRLRSRIWSTLGPKAWASEVLLVR